MGHEIPSLRRTVRQLLFWGLPVAVLYVVFQKIDPELLKASVVGVDLRWVAVGLGMYPLIMVLGASRWNYQLGLHISKQTSLAQTSKLYWMGSPLTWVLPGNLGWDGHRALVAGRKYGHFARNVGVIVVEKIIALIATVLLILIAYPFAMPHASMADYRPVITSALILLVLMMLALGAMTSILKFGAPTELLERAIGYLTRRVRTTLVRLRADDPGDTGASIDFLLRLINPRWFGPVLLYSLAIQITSAVAAQLCFTAVGYDIPFAVNLFVVPFVFLALMLPVSFGGLGIREATFIIMYGQFGVPMEIALLVSFLTLLGVLLNHTIAGAVLWHHGTR